jgi:protein-tyrosine-phosphatase
MRTFTHSLRRLVPIRCTGAGILLLGVIITSVPLGAAEVTASNQGTVIFVCKYGSMKSQMAAAYFNRLAKERGLHLTAISRAFTPDSEIPASLIENMATEGLAPVNEITSLTPGEAASAAKIYSFDEIPAENKGTAEYEHWTDVPASKKDYWGAMSVIKRHVAEEINHIVSTKVGNR